MSTTSRTTLVILDCYTVEPSGLGVPPYLSTYARAAYGALRTAHPRARIAYLTIDDVRWCLNGGQPHEQPPLSDRLTYSATANREQALQLLGEAAVTVVIAGDAVPSVHLQAQNGSVEEIARALACTRGRRVLLGPLANYALADPAAYGGMFDAVHTHTLTSADLTEGTRQAAPYDRLAADRGDYHGLIDQLSWTPVAEIELYRGCTRRRFCDFCNEPVKAPVVNFRTVEDVLGEVALLYGAGLRHFRLGQQTCFFSYMNRDVATIEKLLAEIRNSAAPDLMALHIDNADPLAVASPSGAKIAHLVATYCTEGNCAPMGIESFDPAVIKRNVLTCTPDILRRAVEHVNQAGAHVGPGGLSMLLPGLNLIYGLPGESHRTHYENLAGLVRILDAGLLCHRINVRQARAYPGTPLAAMQEREPLPSVEHFTSWKADIDNIFDQPMKQRVYPIGRKITSLHSFFVTSRGTWHRRLGSYPIQVVERDTARPLYGAADMTITDHAPRYVYGERDDASTGT
ncbi:Radical SAM superfamily enzyme with C-terminal helix-hairpin-helix motif [Sinosporangium album]|uniref:Radical SAM superfamily enzyme with C-terminal helix-hairpin-helix motif n=1 Tax=Sinosporangium album TaxID=504805 RepID=A0A1G8GU00_9ACTN|nr:radical SAM protein [Sinosporangium album]SDH97829.1 Radical SAM superfamily enzyme with C-terminal helix-hairpin-helix motif [Sinosporangium album]